MIVRASDDGTPPLIGELAVTVTVTPVDERPEIDGEASVVDYPENSPTTTVVGRRYTAMDPEGAGVTWSNLSGNDAGKFEFSNTGVLTFKVSPNFEQQPEYEVTLNAFDGGFTGSLTVTVTIADVNEPPTISGEVLVDFTENGTGTVEMYSAMDPDVGATQDWSLAGADGGDFEITNGVLTFINPPDYDMPTDDSRPYNEYLVTVQVNDGANTATRPVTVRVLDVNEAPTVSGNATPSVDENTTAVATYRATDPDERATITWSVEDPGASDFTITNAGALSFASAPNYEVKSSYTVTVRASDGTNNVDHSVTVTVTDEDETEELKLSARRPLIGADYTAAFKEGMGDAVQSPTWAWERSTNGTSGWTAIIIGATAATYRPVGDDRDNYLRVTVSYNDGHSAKILQATSELPTLPDIPNNMPPVFPSPLFAGGATGLSVDENATAGTVVGVAPQATDAELGTLSYSLAVTGFTSDPPFEINATSRQIQVAGGAALDHEDQDSYSVTVTAEDEYNATGTATFDITIEDVNERPVVRRSSGAGAFSIVENSGTDVGRFVATDPEGGGVTWSLATSGDHGRFEIEANGALSFKELPDFESDDLGIDEAYTVTVRATEVDDGDTQTLELTGSLAVTVTITNVNEPPTISGPVVVDFTENGDGSVAMYSATDPDVDATQAWSLAGADGGDFAITDGVLTFIDPPDYDMPTDRSLPNNEYLVTVQVYDGANRVTRPVTVRVLDVNEAPTVSGNLTPSVEENSTAVATYTATDPERATITWSVEDRGASDFTITNAGALSFASAPNYEVESSYTVTVRASDGTNPVDSTVTVTVTDVDEDEELKFSARRPLIGADYTAAFEDGTGDAVQSPTWVWARSMSRSGSGTDITGATAAKYRPVGDDRDNYLRVTVSYDDGHSAKTLQATSELPTLPDIMNNMPPVFPSPLFAGGATGLSVDENATAGTVVGVAPQATDPELGTLSYSLAVDGFTLGPRSRSTPPQGRSRSPAAPHSITRTRTMTGTASR